VLPGDLVRAFPLRAIGRFDLLASFAAQDADEARTVWACQLVAFIISASVAPFVCFTSAITSAFLLGLSAFALPAVFSAAAFFASLAFLAGLRLAFGSWASVAGVPFSIESLII